ncbi:MAG: histidine kinase [Chloroflexota bacterium]|nr:histidine kinase [Chloroflexota bacterium]
MPIRTKLLTALGVLAALLIALGVIGLVALSQANARAERLVDLQRRTAAFSDLRLETTSQLFALAKAFAAPEPRIIDVAIRQVVLTGYSIDRLQFVATEETDLVARVAVAHADFAVATTRTLDLLSAGRTLDAQRAQATEAAPLADRLERLTDELVNRADAEVAQSVSDTRDAYARSQVIVLAFAGASLVLALVLGFAIALSIIGPLRAIGARVERIAEGDFSGQLQVENRDELGTLAANVDRMSDQLGVLYDQLETRAADDERLRLARDLHDLLGHGLSLITIKSQLARRLLAPGDSSRAANEIADIERVARESLQDVRHAVDGYRQPTFTSALAGARAALAAAGIDSTIDVSADSLPSAVDVTLAWAVREGVTNVIRHSGAATCSIRLTQEDRKASLEITDNGAPSAMNKPGNGLRGLQERAAARGGHADAGPLPQGGFRVHVSVPL